MNRVTILLVFALAAALPAVRAQGLVVQKALSMEAAHAVAQGALEKCRADGYKVTVSVVDGSGILKAFVRDNTTGPHTVDLSRRKAFTALTFKRTSAETAKAWATQTPVPNIEGTVGLAGGVPIRAGTEVIGAVGVSGAPGGNLDEACADAGIAKIADKLK